MSRWARTHSPIHPSTQNYAADVSGGDSSSLTTVDGGRSLREITSKLLSMEPVFKLASISNIEKLIKLMSKLYAYDHLPFDEQTARSALQLILGNDLYGCIHLICINEEIVGYLVVTFGFSLEYGGRDAFVDEIYIQEKYRSQGIGKKSLQFAEEICRERGIQALHLEVARENTNAQAVYRKAGFVDHDRYLLTKHL